MARVRRDRQNKPQETIRADFQRDGRQYHRTASGRFDVRVG